MSERRRAPLTQVSLAIEARIRDQAPEVIDEDLQPALIQAADYMPLPSELADLAARLPGVIITPANGDIQTQASNGAFEPAASFVGVWWVNYLWKLPGIDPSQGSTVIGLILEMFMNTTESEGEDEQYQGIVLDVDGCQLEFAIPNTWEFGDEYAKLANIGHVRFGLIVSFASV